MGNKNQYSFFDDAIEVAKLIPYGRITTYGAIAEYLGAKRSARMVGWAMNSCDPQGDIPVHRVVNREGVLTGKCHFDTIKTMEKLLKSEGIEIENNKVKYFEKHFWNPVVELE